MNTSRLRVDMLEDRRVPASIVIAESTFDPGIFGQNIEDAMGPLVVGFGYAVTGPNGAIVAEGGGGYARTPTDGGLAFGSTNSMEIASVAKTITATAVVKILLDQGKDISEPIGGYLPASWDVPADVAALTFEDLLNHTSGFTTRRLTYEDLKVLIEGGMETAQEVSGYNTTNYSLLRIIIPYLLAADGGAELDALPEDQKPQVLADRYFNYCVTEVLEPLGVTGAATGHTSATPTLLYNFPDDGTPGYETPDQRLHVGGMGWNLSPAQMVTFMAGLGDNPDFAAVYQAMKDDFLGLSDSSYSLFGLAYSKGGNNFPQDNDDGDGSGPTRVNTSMADFPGDVQVALVRNSDGGIPVLSDSYENAWTGLVIEGDGSDNTFVLRANAGDPGLLDLVIDGNLFHSFRTDVLTRLELRGLGGHDTFQIQDAPDTLDLILDGGSTGDTFEFGSGGTVFDSVLGNLIVLGGDGTDTLRVLDTSGLSTDYSVRGIHSTEITYDGTIWASDYTLGKLFVYDTIEDVLLEGNGGANTIVVREITPGMTVTVRAGANADTILVSDLDDGVTVNVHGQGGSDSVSVWNIQAGSTVNVYGDQPMLPGGADTCTVGQGDLGRMKGKVFFDGAGGSDLLVLDDKAAPAGRNIDFSAGSVTGSGGFGRVDHSVAVETVRLLGGSRDDAVNVESLDIRTDLDLYGNLGSDVFTIANSAHNVDLVRGDVTIHGEKGYPIQQELGAVVPVDKDQLYVLDDQNAATGDFAIRLSGSVLRGRANKLAGPKAPTLNVVYDQIELTELRAGTAADQILIEGAPWFNQVAVSGGGGADAIDVEWTPAFTGPMRVNGGAGADTMRLSPIGKTLDALHSLLSVEGGSGLAGEVDRLLVSDALSGNLAPYTITKTGLSRPGSAGIQFTGLEELNVNLNNLPNDVALTSSAAGTAVSIAGLGGNDRLMASGLASPVMFVGGLGVKDSIRLVGTGGDDTIVAQGNSMTVGTGSLFATVEQREVDGAGGTDRLVWLGRAGTTESFVLRPSTTPAAGRVTRTPFGPVAYESMEEMTVEGNPGDHDTLQVNGQTQANAFGGGSYFDGFNINLDAAGTSAEPFLVLHDGGGQTMLTLTDHRNVGVPMINGLLGADVFDVRTSAAGPQSRRVRLDGGGQPVGLKGDAVRVHFVKNGSTATLAPSGPKAGAVAVNYGPLHFAFGYQDMEDVDLIPG